MSNIFVNSMLKKNLVSILKKYFIISIKIIWKTVTYQKYLFFLMRTYYVILLKLFIFQSKGWCLMYRIFHFLETFHIFVVFVAVVLNIFSPLISSDYFWNRTKLMILQFYILLGHYRIPINFKNFLLVLLSPWNIYA